MADMKEELIEKIGSTPGGENVKTEGKSVSQLKAILDGLESRGAEEPAAPEPEPEEPAGRYTIAEGKSICCGAEGIKDSGEAVTAANFSEGQKRLDELVEAGVVVDNDAPKSKKK